MTKRTLFLFACSGLFATAFALGDAGQRLPEAGGSIVVPVSNGHDSSGDARRGKPMAFSSDLSQPAAATARRRANMPAAGMPQFFGAVVSSSTLAKGVYEVPSNAQSQFVRLPMERSTDVVNGSVCAVRHGNNFYSIVSEEFEFLPGFFTYSVDAWDINDSGWAKRYTKDLSASQTGTSMASDPTVNVIYGSMVNSSEDGYELCTVEFPKYKSGSITRSVKGALEHPFYAMAVATDGAMYALQDDGQFVTVSKNDARVTAVGPSGLSLTGKGSAVIDPTTGRFFCTAATADGSAGLYEIDLAGGAATLVYAFPGAEQITGLYCNPSEAAAAAPGKATDLAASFPNGELTGTLSFVAPRTDANGNAAHGDLAYIVSLDGTALLNGSTEYGQTVEVTVTLPSDGEHTFAVIMSSDAGNSEAATLKVRAGKGLPKAPAISARWDGSKMLVSWTPVTESADGLYLDPAEVTYKVTRYPDDVVVADGTKATSLEDIFDKPDTYVIYHYEIEAVYGGRTSAVAKSDGVGVGAYTVPYTEDFGTEFYRDDRLDTFTIVDANGDGEGWAYNSYTEVMRCRTMGAPNGTDDWLILPAISLSKDTTYELSVMMHDGGNTLKERVEIKMGLSNTPESMTVTILPEQLVESDKYKEFKAYVNADADGDWYIGFHCTTPGQEYYLYVDDISLVAKAAPGLCQAPSAFTATADAGGVRNVTLTLTAPLYDVAGNALDNIDKLVIIRDYDVIHTIANAEPGKEYTCRDLDVEPGDHEYKAVAWNASGEGDAAVASVFVGFRKPMNPTNAVAVETENVGEVKMTWNAVTTDETGEPLPAGLISYTVVQMAQDGSIYRIIAEGLTVTEHTFTAVAPGEQQFINFAVFAENEAGHSQGIIAPQIIVGTPYPLPYRESFENDGAPNSLFTTATLEGEAYWMTLSDDTFSDMKSHDLDTGYAAMAAYAVGDRAALTSAKISLVGAVNPVLSFYVYNMAGDWGRDDNEIEVQIGVGGKFTSVYSKPNYADGYPGRWHMISVPLTAYEGKVIQVSIIATCHNAAYTVIDEIEIKSWASYDLRAVNFTVSDRLKANQPVRIVAEIENTGLCAAEGASVVLYANDNAYKRGELSPLQSGKTTYVAFDTSVNPSFGKDVKLQVKVDMYEDQNPYNDRSPWQTFALEQTLLPAPEELTVDKVSGGNLHMSWLAPDMSLALPARLNEDFESAEAWKSEVDGWTFLDLDQAGINGFDGVAFPGIPDGSQQSFWVMDDRLEDLNNTFAAASGNKYLANMNVVNTTTDDWAISPRLCGKEHTLSFKAKSYNWMYPESFYVLYSVGGTDPDEFMFLEECTEVPWTWTEYVLTLPEGSTYFAIRSYTARGVMLFIDDVSFVPDGQAEDLELLGYNFYCDGILVNPAPVKETNYIADGYKPEIHTYAVTAVYDKGESRPSNVLTPSGVSDAGVPTVSVAAEGGHIVVRGAQGMSVIVSRTDGVALYSGVPDADLRMTVQPGVYVVLAGDNACKLVVR